MAQQFKKLPNLHGKRIRVKDDAKVFNFNIKGQCFEVKGVDWSSADEKTREPIVKVTHSHFNGYNFSWLKLDQIEIKGGLEACL